MTKHCLRILLPVVVAVSILWGVWSPGPAAEAAARPPAPDFLLLNLSGQEVRLSDFRGKVVLLNFFATFCPPCRMEIPDFVELKKAYAGRGFEVVGISVDSNPVRVLPGFVAGYEINYPVLLGTEDVIRDYGNIYAIPVTFLVDRKGRIVLRYQGMVSRGDLEPYIRRVLAER
ncbi:TlpA family protein disulfide reductase [Dissulfurirhabdus thermomarina]|uniref:TlpA family protein disulfide reductase n=1 Tax=Dissulfurirhabdus thermomarina TaxID=1765737 RepID=A0A6N9TND2_DISTH|nr:TlpA disulfide reductase family protein [Dissulfurirhabdus thermomarina]NDY42649.1 TlpA family protein disulfide reductase [Dissulfurirhabdus thermomarina]NMX23101.1 TlpA family protein disulfide reductase [Dissulfurirhabdus thermomarina]